MAPNQRIHLENVIRPRMVYLQRYCMDMLPPKTHRQLEIMLLLVGPRWDCRVLSRDSLEWIGKLYLELTKKSEN